ncbi:MAG: bifunctional diguanylate cyclase/phosphodiesterase [Cyanobacteriota bacterium]|nr:bifunctional diguanylate cyclase/phosphodiesterase [Cyanobacteriota bacterium]
MHHRCDDHARLLEQLEQQRPVLKTQGLLCCTFRNYGKVEALHGHQAAEALIAAGLERLQALCPPDATVLRLRHDELAVVVPNPGSAAALEQLAKRCAASCQVHHQDSPVPLLLNVAIGAALGQAEQAISSQDLLAQALLARYQAQQRPGNQVAMADAAIQQRESSRYQLESTVATAVDRRQITGYFQPIVNLVDGRAIGFECLARWPQADGLVISPIDFLHQAHNTGITADVDLQVLASSLRAATQLAEAVGGERPLLLSANISAQLIENPHKVDALLELISNEQRPPSVRLQLELLEESLNDVEPELDGLLNRLESLGVLIAIDDFGTGYSSLSRLHTLAINTIKIDRSFVSRINAKDKSSNHLLQTLIAISHDLQIDLTAEGIETEEQRKWLLSRGVDHGQGYLFAKPMDLEDAVAYLKAQST